jgi:predicted alpha/beta hydrolase family esterase
MLTQTSKRPIIFMAHSLGGIIVKSVSGIFLNYVDMIR